MKHVISHIHLVFMYWMKHVTSQLSGCSCLHSFIRSLISSAVWYHLQFDIVSEFDIICSLILSAVWYYLQSDIVSLFNPNCAPTSLYILRLDHALLILYFLHYIVTESDDIFQKEAFVMNMMLSQHLVSPDYSSCASQIYILVHSFIALRKSIFFTLIFWAYMSL